MDRTQRIQQRIDERQPSHQAQKKQKERDDDDIYIYIYIYIEDEEEETGNTPGKILYSTYILNDTFQNAFRDCERKVFLEDLLITIYTNGYSFTKV